MTEYSHPTQDTHVGVAQNGSPQENPTWTNLQNYIISIWWFD